MTFHGLKITNWTQSRRMVATVAGQITSELPIAISSCIDRSVKYALILYQLTYRGLFV